MSKFAVGSVVVRNWANTYGITTGKIAKIIYELTDGDERLIKVNSSSMNSGLWEICAKQLFPWKASVDLEKALLMDVWENNENSIRDTFLMLKTCYENSKFISNQAWSPTCNVCHHKADRSNFPIIECNLCKILLHPKCGFLWTNSTLNIKQMICPSCIKKQQPQAEDYTTESNNQFSRPPSKRIFDEPVSSSGNMQQNLPSPTPIQKKYKTEFPYTTSKELDPGIAENFKSSQFDEKPKTNLETLASSLLNNDDCCDKTEKDPRLISEPDLKLNVKPCTPTQAKKDAQNGDTTNVSMPTSFEIKLSKDEWKEVVEIHCEEQKEIHKIVKDYGNVLARKCYQFNNACVQSFHKSFLRQPEEVTSSRLYFRAHSYCKGKSCKAKFAFNLAQIPQQTQEDVVILVSVKGEIAHKAGEKNFRFCKGKERKEAKKETKPFNPSKVFYERVDQASLEELRQGNHDRIKNLQIFRQLKCEAQKDEDFHEDFLTDLILTQLYYSNLLNNKKAPGYIETLGVNPLNVLIYSEQCFTILRNLTKASNITLFIDATSNVAANMPMPLDQRKIFYYSVVAKFPTKGSMQIPLAQFYLTEQTLPVISSCLEYFFNRYRTAYNLSEDQLGVSHIEVDFSKAILGAVTKSTSGCNLEHYLVSMWNHLVHGRVFKYVPVHICRLHCTRFLIKALQRFYPKKQFGERASKIFKPWFFKFISCRNMETLQKYCLQILWIVGSDFLNKRVSDCINNIVQPNIEMRAQDFDVVNPSVGQPFYLRSPFGNFFFDAADFLEKENEVEQKLADDKIVELETNEFCNKDMLRYLTVEIFPYAPLLTKIPFTISNQPVTDDTTNVCESYFSHFKNILLEKKTNQKLPRVIRKTFQPISGIYKLALSNFSSHLNQNDECREASNNSDCVESEPEDITKLETDNQEYIDFLDDYEYTDYDSCHNAPEGLPVSPEKQEEGFKKRRFVIANQDPVFNVLEGMPLLPWGSFYKHEEELIKLENTCSFDNVIFIFYYLYNYTDQGNAFLSKKITESDLGTRFLELMKYYEREDWISVKTLWIDYFLQINIFETKPLGDMWSDEQTALQSFASWFPLKLSYRCAQKYCPANKEEKIIYLLEDVIVRKFSDFKEKMDGTLEDCHSSRPRTAHQTLPIYSPLPDSELGLIIVHLSSVNLVKESELDYTVHLFGSAYQVAAYTVYQYGHFKTVLWLKDGKKSYDGKKSGSLQRWNLKSDLHVGTIFLLKM